MTKLRKWKMEISPDLEYVEGLCKALHITRFSKEYDKLYHLFIFSQSLSITVKAKHKRKKRVKVN